MKLNNKILFALALTPAMLLGSCNGGNADDTKNASSAAGGDGSTITIWCSETEGVATSFENLAKKWAADNNLNYNFEVTGITEADAATNMLTDVAKGADIYCFAQDQFARLVQGGALSVLGPTATTWVRENNIEDAASATFSGESCYAYPLTADNGYFMYYDKRVVKDEHIGSLEDIIKDCEDYEEGVRKFSMELTTSGWYTASFFMSYGEDNKPLCHSTWTTNDDGAYIGVDDTWCSANGIIAAKGMQKLLKSEAFYSSSKASDFTAATPSAVVVSGTWDYTTAKAALKENMGVAPLPSFTVDNKSYHMGSFKGYKLMGVKPQTDVAKAANLHKLAQYLTSKDAEMSRLTEFGWGPSNKVAQTSDEFKANPALSAFEKQRPYATTQGQIHGSWWDVSKVVGSSLQTADGTDEAIQKVLDTYKAALDEIINASPEAKRAFTVIGNFATAPTDGWASWSSDLAMNENPTNTWTSPAITLAVGDSFKCRQGKSWDVCYGRGDDKDGNTVIKEGEAGSKKIQLVTTVDATGTVTGGTVTLLDA